jgi:hypothetical protein
MVFFLEIKNTWQKSQDFWFAKFFLKVLKSIGWYGFSYGFVVVLNVFHHCFLLQVLNFTNAVLSKTTFRRVLVS